MSGVGICSIAVKIKIVLSLNTKFHIDIYLLWQDQNTCPKQDNPDVYRKNAELKHSVKINLLHQAINPKELLKDMFFVKNEGSR